MSNYKPIGEYIELVDERNHALKIKLLLGLTISKQFIASVANTVGSNMRNYKIIRKNQFACSLMQVRRDKKLPVALLQDYEEAIISQAYPVFKIKNEKHLLPEYLMMWFTRAEFDREASFYAVGGVRGSLEWEDFCQMKLPVPSIEKQRAIVAEYNTVKKRIALNNQLIQKLEETAQAIYKQWFVDFEFPISEADIETSIERSRNESRNGSSQPLNSSHIGKPYKSSGGKMVWNEELEKEIPEGWEIIELSQIIDVVNGFAFKSNDFSETGKIPIIKIANITPPSVEIQNAQYYSIKDYSDLTRFIVEKGDILISMTGSHMNQINSAVGKVGRYYFDDRSLLNQRVGKLKPKINCSEFLFLFMNQQDSQKHLLMGATGSANQANISPGLIKSIKLPLPPRTLLDDFEIKISTVSNYRIIKYNDNSVLHKIGTLLHSKLATIEN